MITFNVHVLDPKFEVSGPPLSEDVDFRPCVFNFIWPQQGIRKVLNFAVVTSGVLKFFGVGKSVRNKIGGIRASSSSFFFYPRLGLHVLSWEVRQTHHTRDKNIFIKVEV